MATYTIARSTRSPRPRDPRDGFDLKAETLATSVPLPPLPSLSLPPSGLDDIWRVPKARPIPELA